MKPLSSKILLWLGFVFVFLGGVSVFQFNSLHTAENGVFETFDRFSQALVAGNIIAHDAGSADKTWNLGFASINGETGYSDNIWTIYVQAAKDNAVKSVTFNPYPSQYGIQGVAFLALHNLFGINDVPGLQMFNVVVFSLVITALSFLYAKVYDCRFGVLFFLVMIGSPWVVSFARNLYWIPFSWFLPALFAAMLYLSKTALNRAFCLFGIGAAVFLKSLAGYEYLSNVTLFACSVFAIAPFFREKNRQHRFNFKLGCLVFIACVLGFACALFIHAGMRGDTLSQGLINILEQDVKRRTYGDPSHFDPVLRASLTVSVADVLSMYWTQWRTPVVAWMPAQGLNFAAGFVLLGLVYSLIKRKAVGVKVLAILSIYFLASISWFVAAKAHSFVHTQLNYVLWYFGFIQALAYGVLSMALLLGGDFLAWRRTLTHKGNLLLAYGAMVGLFLILCMVAVTRVERFEQDVDARMADSIASFDVGNGFKVFFSNDHEALLLKPQCSDFEPEHTFLLHAYPNAPQTGIINMDFQWRDRAIASRWFSKYSDACLAALPLPAIKMKSLSVGQYDVDAQQVVKVLWQGSANFEGARYLDTVVALDYTDGNWEKGVSRTLPGFFIRNNFVNRQSLAIGDVLKLGVSQQRPISRIDYSNDFINVYFEGALLDPQQSGFPNKIEILHK